MSSCLRTQCSTDYISQWQYLRRGVCCCAVPCNATAVEATFLTSEHSYRVTVSGQRSTCSRQVRSTMLWRAVSLLFEALVLLDVHRLVSRLNANMNAQQLIVGFHNPRFGPRECRPVTCLVRPADSLFHLVGPAHMRRLDVKHCGSFSCLPSHLYSARVLRCYVSTFHLQRQSGGGTYLVSN